jgi:hypothetical protein
VPWAEELLELLRDNQPIFFALLGDRNVFARFKERLRERQTGLVAVFQAAAGYVEAEQRLGRIDARVVPEVVASILIGACRDHTFTGALAGTGQAETGGFARELVRTTVRGLAPPSSNAEEEPS